MKIFFFFLAYIENLPLKDDFLKISSFVCELQSTPSYNPFSQMNIWEHSKKEAGIWPVVFVSCSQGWVGAGWGWSVVSNCFIVAQESYIYLANRLQDGAV